MLACVGVSSITAAPSCPSGWTQIDKSINTDVGIVTCNRTASSEPASYVWSWTGAAAQAGGIIAAFRYTGIANVIDNHNIASSSTGQPLTIAAPSGGLGSPIGYLACGQTEKSTTRIEFAEVGHLWNQEQFSFGSALIPLAQIVGIYPLNAYSDSSAHTIGAVIGFH